jgi:metal-responsive CopG/Arc/MetJ family transcriptional regulator
MSVHIAYMMTLGQEVRMAQQKVRLNLQVSAELNQMLETIAEDTGAQRSDVIRQALALMKVAHEARRNGKHIGLVSDPQKLETEIVGLL